MKRNLLLLLLLCVFAATYGQHAATPRKRVLCIAEQGTPHQGFCDAAKTWLDNHKEVLNIETTWVADLSTLPKGFFKQFSVVMMLNYPPYSAPQAWSEDAARDFERYVDEGQGNFIGFHHATLLGNIFGAGEMWQWFSDFMGGIRWTNYISTLTDATVDVEDKQHPVMKDVPDTFLIEKDEWYTYDRNPRPNVHVLAHVDEHSYAPSSMIRMGDHPVVWTNERKKAKNVYFQFGHSASLFASPAFVKMFENAIRWQL